MKQKKELVMSSFAMYLLLLVYRSQSAFSIMKLIDYVPSQSKLLHGLHPAVDAAP